MNYMGFLNLVKKKKVYTIIKVFKVVNSEQAKQFEIKKCFSLCSDFFKDQLGSFTDHISINYQNKTWKTPNGFLKGVKEKSNEDIVYLSSYYFEEKNLNYFILSNSMMNLDNPPKQGTIDIELSIETEKISENCLLKFFNDVHEILNFNYGFTIELDNSYDFNYERKRTFFAKSKKQLAGHLTRQWFAFNVGIKEGFIKKLYKFNILNSSHLQQPVIRELISQGVGDLEKLNDKLTIWRLTDDHFEIANAKLNQSKYVIYNESNPDLFLQTEEAKRFNELMKLK